MSEKGCLPNEFSFGILDIFNLIVGTFNGLSDTDGPSFRRIVEILDTLVKYRSCVVMLDLECDDLVNEMFSTFFSVVRDDHPESVLSAMQTIMIVVLEESEDVRDDLLLVILSTLGVTQAAKRLAMNVIEQCSEKLEAGELLVDLLDTRLRAVRLVGSLFALPGANICEASQPIFSEFLMRLTGRVVDVRMSVLEHVKICLLSDPSRPEAP
ncbi:hypothetical protein GOBAR_DD27469 [Gossypium barbadense]|nr:hypothetical protein GOBAR_DD27469 [Gossypium barbadense]